MARRPGRPKGGRLSEEVRDRFWDTLRTGVSIAAAGRSVGVSRSGGSLWVREAGGVLPKTVNPALEAQTSTGTGPLSFTDRCRIEELLRARYYPAQIGRLLGRPTSTITREIARGTASRRPYLSVIT